MGYLSPKLQNSIHVNYIPVIQYRNFELLQIFAATSLSHKVKVPPQKINQVHI